MKPNSSPIPPLLALAACAFALVGCQSATSPDTQTSGGAFEVLAVFELSDSSHIPDSTAWSTRSQSGRGGFFCTQIAVGDLQCTDSISPKASLGPDTVGIQLWKLGVQLAVLYFHDVGGSGKLTQYDTVQRNAPDLGLISAFSLLCKANSQSLASKGPGDLVAFYAALVLARDTGYKDFPSKLPAGITIDTIQNTLGFFAGLDNFPTTLPTGMNRDSLLKEMILLAADSGKTQAEIVALGLDTATIHAWVDTLLKDKLIPPADTLGLVPMDTVRAPTFSLVPGSYKGVQSVTLSSATPGDTIRYTTDSTLPTPASAIYSGSLQITASETVKAIAVKAGMIQSPLSTAKYTITFDTAATPTFSPLPGTYTGSETVSIASATTGDTIRYTTNGDIPGPTSPVYSGSLLVTGNETIQAIAVKAGITTSPVSTAAYAISLDTAPSPVFSLAGGPYAGPQKVAISSAPGDSIFYTTDGSAPTAVSKFYSDSVSIRATTTLQAITVKFGLVNSKPTSATYTIPPRDSALNALSTSPGTFASTFLGGVRSYVDSVDQGVTSVVVTATPRTPGDVNGITFNGSSSPMVILDSIDPDTIPVQVTNSNGNSLVYSIVVFHRAPAAPTFTPSSGLYTSTQTVTIASATAGAKIFYTMDGSTPSNTSSPYTGPVAVAGSSTLEAVAIGTGSVPSRIGSAAYEFDTAKAPTFSPAGGYYIGSQLVTLSSATAGAVIHYTTDGSTPTKSSPPYLGPISVPLPETVRAIAVENGDVPSPVSTATYSTLPIFVCPSCHPVVTLP
jgi:hypothetical protein